MVFLALVIITPLMVAIATISINSKIISDDITSGIDQLEARFAASISMAAATEESTRPLIATSTLPFLTAMKEILVAESPRHVGNLSPGA